jgi:hypothetical protein
MSEVHPSPTSHHAHTRCNHTLLLRYPYVLKCAGGRSRRENNSTNSMNNRDIRRQHPTWTCAPGAPGAPSKSGVKPWTTKPLRVPSSFSPTLGFVNVTEYLGRHVGRWSECGPPQQVNTSQRNPSTVYRTQDQAGKNSNVLSQRRQGALWRGNLHIAKCVRCANVHESGDSSACGGLHRAGYCSSPSAPSRCRGTCSTSRCRRRGIGLRRHSAAVKLSTG